MNTQYRKNLKAVMQKSKEYTDNIYVLATNNIADKDTSTNILAKTSNQGIYVGSDTGHWYYWNGTEYADGGVYQAISFNKGDIKYYDTDFITTGRNLFNKNAISNNTYLSADSGTTSSMSDWFVSDYISIDSVNNSYIIVRPSNAFRMAFYDGAKTYISGTVLSGSSASAVAIPSNAQLMRVCYVMTQTDNVMLEYGQTPTPYEEFEYILKYSRLSVPDHYLTYYKTDFVITGKNLFNKGDIEENKYVSTDTGQVANSNGFFASGFIPIDNVNNSYVTFRPSSSCRVCFYNENKEFISGVFNTSNAIEIPANTKYAKVSYTLNSINSVMFEYGQTPSNYEKFYLDFAYPKDKEYVITTTEGLLQGIINAYTNQCNKILVKRGDYDIIAEYEAKYGSDYFTNYATNYNGKANGVYDRGIWLENLEIKFESGAKVVCNYTGSNTNVVTYFSAFAVGRNVIIDGLVLIASELRYGIHPDFNGTDTAESYFIVRNCDLSFQAGSNNIQTLGCGLPITGYWLFENNIFRNPLNLETFVMRIHNNGDSNAISKVYFKNNYIVKGYFQFNYYGSSEKITNILLSGNSWTSNPQKTHETQESIIDNLNIILCNNETRT